MIAQCAQIELQLIYYFFNASLLKSNAPNLSTFSKYILGRSVSS